MPILARTGPALLMQHLLMYGTPAPFSTIEDIIDRVILPSCRTATASTTLTPLGSIEPPAWTSGLRCLRTARQAVPVVIGHPTVRWAVAKLTIGMRSRRLIQGRSNAVRNRSSVIYAD